MKQFSTFLMAIAVVAVGFVGAGQAQASTITAKMQSGSINGWPTVQTNMGNFLAGEFTWDVTNDPGNHVDDIFKSFCIELVETVSPSQTYTWHVVDPDDAPNTGVMGSVKADQLAMLFGGFYGDLLTSAHRAAFQLAIWEIVYDTNLNISTGSFHIKNGTLTAYQGQITSWLDAVALGNLPKANLIALSSPYGGSGSNVQDQVVALAPGTTPIAPVPLPPAAAMGLGMLGLMGVRRWRAARQAV